MRFSKRDDEATMSCDQRVRRVFCILVSHNLIDAYAVVEESLGKLGNGQFFEGECNFSIALKTRSGLLAQIFAKRYYQR
jgi:hypothetical protein